ncbi:hypothetical protein GGF50DRAFT_121527 [Schizophyllum commune]
MRATFATSTESTLCSIRLMQYDTQFSTTRIRQEILAQDAGKSPSSSAERHNSAPNAESPTRNGFGISVRRAEVSPSRAHRLPATLALLRQQPPFAAQPLALSTTTPHRRTPVLIAASHINQSNGAPRR